MFKYIGKTSCQQVVKRSPTKSDKENISIGCFWKHSLAWRFPTHNQLQFEPMTHNQLHFEPRLDYH